MRLLSYNIRYGGTRRADPIADVIRACEPDVVVLQEATDPRVVARVAELAALPAWGARAGHSLGFLARTTPAAHEWRWGRSSRHAFLDLVPGGSTLRIYGVHLSAMHANWAERRRVRELGALLDATRGERSDAHALVGDFNTLAPGEELELRRLPPRLRPIVWLSGGRVRWQVVSHLEREGYADAWRVGHEPRTGFTFPTWDAHVRLDYVFVPAADSSRVRSCRVIDDHPSARAASDHFPLLVELTA
jgi:endonuclease/exonuclease/phosphatase family metal-dependent hydrolase